MLYLLFNLFAKVRGGHWAKGMEECEQIAIATFEYLQTKPQTLKKAKSAMTPIMLVMVLGYALYDPLKYEYELVKFRSKKTSEPEFIHDGIVTGFESESRTLIEGYGIGSESNGFERIGNNFGIS